MILSDSEIWNLIKKKELIIHPILERDQVHCAKVDVRLDNVLYGIKRLESASFDVWEDDPKKYTEIKKIPFDQKLVLHPFDFMTAPLFEMFKLPNYLVGRLDGRSSLGRLGIIVHTTAAGIDPGYSGKVVCELVNLGTVPVKIAPLTRVASISFERIEGNVDWDYARRKKMNLGKYGSRIESAMSQDPDKEAIARMIQRL